MTTIITYRTDKKVYMLADQQATIADTIKTLNQTKIFNFQRFLIGICGTIEHGYPAIHKYSNTSKPTEILEYFAEYTRKQGESECQNVGFLYADRKDTFYIDHGGYYKIGERFYACGSGEQLAYGAYEMLDWELDKKRKYLVGMPCDETYGYLKQIVKVCITRDTSSGGQIDILELDI